MAWHSKLATILLVPELWIIFLLGRVYVVVDRIINSSKTKPSIQNSSAVLFVSLSEAWVLVELRENFVQRRYRMIALQMLQLFLYGSTSKLVILALLQEMPLVTRV